jgi:hypothetical protein
LGFGIRPRGPEHLTEPAHEGHHVRRRDAAVEVDGAALDGGGQVLVAHHVGAGGAGLIGLGAAGEDAHADGLAGAVGQADHAADHLVGVAGVDAEVHRDLDGLVELGRGIGAHQGDRLVEVVELLGLDLGGQGLHALAELGHRFTPPPRSCPSSGRSLRAC